ncbi:hypothetical protein EIN_020110 [Entamoeba invadens IP1]|uniref:hypothetical protein n=1 Tax=Entamoeba invadens IP1 TaxID=370355 RepID=UPI0002C3F272|nr:hypothetical protein EIN_020110 [Entamoeba invadens IP1]ELP90562.1 hypothetical protein EIN_020110 [Entamoeba invadens IP1]|eukprot:XP_004257333.1 hypothetical protein EIN_020110 [Entamoeba invadens IP1]
MRLFVVCILMIVGEVSAVKRMRFKKARKNGAYTSKFPHPQNYGSGAPRRNSVGKNVVEVCVPVACGSGEAIGTECDFSDNYKVACTNVQEKKCTGITLQKSCKSEKSVMYVSVEKESDKGYEVKAFKDVLCTKPYGIPITEVFCKANNMRNKKYSCNKEGIVSLGALCKCSNCETVQQNEKTKIKTKGKEVHVNIWIAVIVPLAAIAIISFVARKK